METKLNFGECNYICSQNELLAGICSSINVGHRVFTKKHLLKGPRPSLSGLAFTYTVKGSAVISTASSKVLHYKKKSFSALIPDLIFTEQVSESPWETFWLVLWGPIVKAVKEAINRDKDIILIENPSAKIISHLANTCKLIFEQLPGWQWKFLSLVTILIEDFIETFLSSRSEISVTEQIISLMSKGINDSLSLSEIAESTGVSYSSLTHKFRHETGMSPAKFYNRLRIDHAKQLLANGLAVSQVSKTMGFENQFHFSKLFKSYEKISPLKFKTEILTKIPRTKNEKQENKA